VKGKEEMRRKEKERKNKEMKGRGTRVWLRWEKMG
jgi:hypothetical protein